MKNKKQNYSFGYSLIELVIVMGIIAILSGIALNGLAISNRQQLFLAQFDQVFSMINNARSLAIAGKGQLDYVDYDQDGCKVGVEGCDSDFVTPGNYGVNFSIPSAADEPTEGPTKLLLFADMHPPLSDANGAYLKFNSGFNYASGHDLVLKSLEIDSRFDLNIYSGSSESLIKFTDNSASIFYSPLYADINYENISVNAENPFFVVQLKEKSGVERCRQIKIHTLAGIPEAGACEEIMAVP